MVQEDLIYTDAAGTEMRSLLVLPDGDQGPVPAVLVIHEAFGLGDHVIERAERLAGNGYAALAVDMFGGRRTADDLPTGMALIGEATSDPAVLFSRVSGAIAALRSRPEVDADRIAAIGFCFGGSVALELARGGGDVLGVVSLHGTLATTSPAKPGIKAAVLVCHGDADPLVPPEQVAAFSDEMRAAGADWQIDIYGGVKHGFTNKAADRRGVPALGYHARADRMSWASTVEFLARIFGK